MVIATKIRTSSISSAIEGGDIDAKLANLFLDSTTTGKENVGGGGGGGGDDGGMMMVEPIGATVRRALVAASREDRAIVGLSESINALSKTPEDFLFCFLAASGNPANHMHQVLLEAFCFEHDIYIIKVGSVARSTRLAAAPPSLFITMRFDAFYFRTGVSL